MFTNKSAILFIFLLISIFVYAQEDSLLTSIRYHTIDEVVVSATRSEQKISNLPIHVQVITKEEIEKTNAVRLTDLLAEQTGLVVVEDFRGNGIQMQGFDSEYTLIMIDGVPLIGRTAGTLDLNRISTGSVKRIEIIKGASSSLYGNEALGGVINIITDTPRKGVDYGLKYKVGSFSTHDLSAKINYRKDQLSVSSFGNYYSTNGYKLNETSPLNTVEPYDNHTFTTKIQYQLSDYNKVTISGRYFSQNQEINSITLDNSTSNIKEWNVHAKYYHRLNNHWKGQLEFYSTNHHAKEDNQLHTGTESNFNHFLLRPEVRMYYSPNAKSSIIFGGGITHELLKKNQFAENPSFNAPYLYVQYDGSIADKTSIIIGGRYDYHTEYSSKFSPKIALKQQLNKFFSVRGSVGYGFKTPDFRTLYYDFTNSAVGYTVLGYTVVPTKLPQMISNNEINQVLIPLAHFKESTLQPESSVSFNLGVDYKANNKISSNINFFRNNINDLINTVAIAKKTNGFFVYSYENLNKVYTQGVELNAKYKLNSNFNFNVGYQLLYAFDKEAKENFKQGKVYAKDNQLSSFKLKEQDYFGLFNRSRHIANFKVFYQNKKSNIDANIRLTYRSKFGRFDTNGNGYLDSYDQFAKGYLIADIALQKKIYNIFDLGVGIDNILNFTDPQNSSSIPGRIGYITLNINF